MLKLKLRKKDKVVVISGKEKGKTGEVIRLIPEKMRVVVAKLNMVSRHRKARQNEPAGIQKMEAPLAYSNVMLVCPKCEKGVRPKLDTLQTGEKVRLCRKCGETIV